MKTTTIIKTKFQQPGINDQALVITKALKAHFARHSNQCYLLLDPFLRNFIDDDFIYERIENKAITDVLIPHASVDKTRVPFIISLDLNKPEDNELLFHSVYESLFETHPKRIAMGEGRRFCGWLSASTATKLTDLSLYMGRVAIQRLSEDKTILLRLYDPAVMIQLWFLLSEVQRRILFGLVDDWSIITGEGELYTFPASEATLFGAHSLGLSPDQYKKISWIGAINRGLCFYRQLDNRPWISDLQVQKILFPLFERTQHYSFNSYDDINDLAIKALTVHPYFDKHPLLALRVTGMPSPVRYRDLIHGITQPEWTMIQNDCIASYGSLSDLLMKN
ncbi:hypothetical protein SOASR032_04290 [Pragia fontium]|uniref:DUF4123 domain-containing protein n=1 Tax=Pragia fontium TaxID=82985 RepID=A0ABQ5LE21_9GAMM|nr:DUF4123 domain-containing protein [Pragia fontium]GKX61860.1 hypothetical protein SOASR032_04290 [Pragia fontium]